MFASSLPLLPPPPTSLLPSLVDRSVPDASPIAAPPNSLQAQQQQQQQRRTRGHPHSMYPRSDLAVLAYDERTITQRKMAIAMYGYSWLKPAGCVKTMLGRREEEIEREEVERQLREVELQEQNAAEAEEAERDTHLNQQRAREAQGEDVGAEGERDLDEDVPDMDEEDVDDFDDDDVDSDENDEEGEENLDHSIAEGDSAWRYDTTRDLDTESEDERHRRLRLQPRQSQSQVPTLNVQNRGMVNMHRSPTNPTLYGDEFGGYDEDQDLDDDIPDEDGNQNLDDDIPDAESEDNEWEHTDTELEESEMDISIMPPGVTAHHTRSQMSSHAANTHDFHETSTHRTAASQQNESRPGMRRTSGNIPSSLPTSNPSVNPPTGARGLVRSQHQRLNFTPDQLESDFSASALISTGYTEASSGTQQSGNSFSDAAGARRNLFGTSRVVAPRNDGYARDTSGGQAFVTAIESSFEATQNVTASFQTTTSRQISSGGLFTPSPLQQNVQRVDRSTESVDVPSRTTRSGRVISRIDRMRAARRPGAA